MKPNIQVSKCIAKGSSHDADSNGKNVYRLKAINFGRRQVINISATCSITQLIDVRGGERRITKYLKLKTDNVPVLGPKNAIGDMWRITPVWIVVIHADTEIESMLNERTRVQFTIISSDALSNTTVAQRVSYTRDQIKSGDFEWGLNFNIYEQASTKSEA